MLVKLVAKLLPRKEIDRLIANKKRWILENSCPEKIILVGSAARYEMTDASDIDLIVIFSDQETLNQQKGPLLKNRPKGDWPHDLVLVDRKSYRERAAKGGGICWLAEREGWVLYDRRKHDT